MINNNYIKNILINTTGSYVQDINGKYIAFDSNIAVEDTESEVTQSIAEPNYKGIYHKITDSDTELILDYNLDDIFSGMAGFDADYNLINIKPYSLRIDESCDILPNNLIYFIYYCATVIDLGDDRTILPIMPSSSMITGKIIIVPTQIYNDSTTAAAWAARPDTTNWDREDLTYMTRTMYNETYSSLPEETDSE